MRENSIGRKGYWNRLMAVCMLLILLMTTMTGCGRGNQEDGTVTGGESTIMQEDAVIQVGDKRVSEDEIMFYMLCVREQYEGYFGEEVWSVNLGTGQTFEDLCKEDILNEIVQLKVITSMAEAEGVMVTEDEADEIADTVREQMEEISELDALLYHIDEEMLVSIYHDNYLSSKMFDVVTSDVDTTVPDEEARCAELLVLTLVTKGEDKNLNQIDQTSEEREKTREKAEELRAQAVGMTSDPDAEEGKEQPADIDTALPLAEGVDFESLATVHSDLEETSVTLGRGQWKEDFDQKVFDEAAFALKTGEVSPVVEGEHGFYIIYCVNEMDEDATAQAKESIINVRQDEAFQKLYAEWAKQYEVTVDEEKWEKITFARENQAGALNQME